MTALSVSIVTFRTDPDVLRMALRDLGASVEQAIQRNLLDRVCVVLVDNSDDESSREQVRLVAENHERIGGNPVIYRLMPYNVGFGVAHNEAIRAATSDFHLIMNPDVEIDESAVAEAASLMTRHGNIALLAPQVRGADGTLQFLNRRYPSVLVLFVRGFVPTALQRYFDERLGDYEIRELPQDRLSTGIPLASGCFMFCRTRALQAIGGFSPRYFLYFEDYDLCLRVNSQGDIAYAPSVRVRHFGGKAARKGWRHVWWFARSATTFFRTHGFKFA